MKSLFTLLIASIVSVGLLGQQDIQQLKDLKDLKENAYTKKHRSGSTMIERNNPRHHSYASSHLSGQIKGLQGSLLKTGNASKQKMDSVRWEFYDAHSASWILSDRDLYTYDDDGNMTTYVWFAWDSVEMKVLPYDKETIKYDDQGNATEIIWLIWDNDSGQWVNFGKFEFSYDGDGNMIQQIISDWDPDGSQWLEGLRTEMTYDGSGNILLSLWHSWDEDSGKLVLSLKEEYLYEDGILTTLNEYTMEEGEWALYFRTLYNYDNTAARKSTTSGTLSEKISQFWDSDGNAWFEFGKTLYAYNENDRLALEEVWEFSYTQFMVAKTMQYEYAWDADGNMTSQIDKHWDEELTKGTNSWQNTSKSEWTFNKDYSVDDLYVPYWFFLDESNITFAHMPVSEEIYVYVIEDWVMDSRQSAYYSDFSASTGIEDREEASLKIFPMPASETLTIKWNDSYANLRFELYDLTGKRVILRTIDNNETIGVNHLSGGMYLYKLSNNDHLVYSGKVSIR